MGLSRVGSGPAAIVVALPWEAVPLAKDLGLLKQGLQDGVTFYRGWEDRLLLLQAGMGREGAARATLFLEKPVLLLSAGFCGGTGPEVRLGDLVVGSRVVGIPQSFPADPSLLDRATRTLKALALPFHTGTILTVDRVASPTHQREEGWREMGVLAVDMESAYLADWAEQQGIPFLAIRVVSDTPSEPWAAEAGLFIASDGRLRPGALFAHLLRHPFSISRLIPLARKLREATAHLTKGIRALLKEQEW